ncbi:uncharacterized protein LOC135834081 [Planococcus citri]|uniref:uncharacterized protein LOC135834081 n=1 Tax=Planococcus citri TaxID=170843 RepID=UPI0031F953F3
MAKAGGFGKYQRKLLIKMLPISLSSVLSVNTIIYALPAFICEFSVSKYHQGLLLCAIYIVMALLIIPRHVKFDIFHMVNINSWRLFILCCSIFPFLGLLSTLLLLEESPAFLLEEGNSEKSLKILRKIYSTNTGKAPETFPVRKLMGPKRETGTIRRASTRLKPLLQDPYVLPVTIAYIFQGITMAAFSAIKLYHTLLFTVSVGAGQFDNVTLSDAHAKPFCELFKTQEIFLKSVHCTKMKINDEVYLGAVIVGFTVFMSLFGTKLLIERFNKMVLFVIGHLTSAICMIIFPFSSWAYVLILMSIFFVCMQNCVTISISLIVNRVPPFMRYTFERIFPILMNDLFEINT